MSLASLVWPNQSLAQSVGVGQVFPPFDAKDAITGQPVNLNDFRGKVVIIDFWATWCGPCIRELPNVKRVYQKYKDQGLEIISISLDSNRQKFQQFVKQQRMNWPQIMEGNGWNTRLAKKYNVRSIPKMYVLDASGVVVSDSARGEALASAVAKSMSTVTDPKPSNSGTSPSDDIKRTDMDQLLAQLERQKEMIDSAAQPYNELNRTLDSSREQLNRTSDLLVSANGRKRAAVTYNKAHQLLQDGRLILFREGGMGDVMIYLPPPPPDPRQTAQLQVIQQVEQDINAADEANSKLKRAIDQHLTDLYAARAQVNELKRQLRRRSGAIDKHRANVKASEQQVLAAKTALDQGWRTHLKQADQTLVKLIGDDKQRLAAIEQIQKQIAECQELVAQAAVDPRQSRPLKRNCQQLWESVERFTQTYSGVTNSDNGLPMPLNPFKERGHNDIQGRVAAAKALDSLDQIVLQWKNNSNKQGMADHPRMKQIAELQRQLEQAGEDAQKLAVVQEQYNEFCTAFLKQMDEIQAK